MNKFIEVIIYFCAIIVAFILLFIGIRKIKINNKKYNFFLTTLFIALSIFGCSSKNNNVDASTVISQNIGNIDGLNQNQNWIEFRNFFNKINYVEHNFDSIGNRKYPGLNTNEYYDALREDLTLQLKNLEILKDSGLINEVEIRMFENLFTSRINYLEYGYDRALVLTRMVPSPIDYDREILIESIEKRIDTLMYLRKSGDISDDEFSVILENLTEDIKQFSIISEIYNNIRYSYTQTDLINYLDNILEKHIELFEINYNDFLKRKNSGEIDMSLDYYIVIDSFYEKTKIEIEEINKTMPSFRLLIKNLIESD